MYRFKLIQWHLFQKYRITCNIIVAFLFRSMLYFYHNHILTERKSIYMGKKISVYWSTILVTIPIILAVFFVMIFITYNYVYNITYNNSIDHIKKAAELTDEVLADYDLHDRADAEEAEEILDSVCEQFDVAYVYVLQINKDTGTQRYLTLGTGEDASENFKQERYIGYVFNDEPNEYELSALDGKTDNNIEHLINQFGDTICYNLGRTSKNAKDEIICSEIDLTSFTKSLRLDFMRSATIPVLLVVFISILFSIVLHFKVSKPARIISNKMTGFIQEHEERFKPLEINASKEFHDIAESYNKMASDIDRYLVDLSELNRQKAELNIARNIQMGLLEPADYSDSSYRIKAYMLPAKDVGGDLYEYQLLPDGKMCVVIADVSDKGISALRLAGGAHPWLTSSPRRTTLMCSRVWRTSPTTRCSRRPSWPIRCSTCSPRSCGATQTLRSWILAARAVSFSAR